MMNAPTTSRIECCFTKIVDMEINVANIRVIILIGHFKLLPEAVANDDTPSSLKMPTVKTMAYTQCKLGNTLTVSSTL